MSATTSLVETKETSVSAIIDEQRRIHGNDDDKQLFIDPEVCIDCGACVSACPVEAIYADSNVPDKWKNYTAINAEWYKK